MSDQSDDWFEVEDDPDYEGSDEWFLDWICGMGADGQCTMAGSEECDWECPRMRRPRKRIRRPRKRK